MAKNPTPSLLDPGQIIKRSFDDANDAIRVDANLTVSGPLEVAINDIDDSIKIGDGLGDFLKINPDGSINVNSSGSGPTDVNANIEGLASFQTQQYTIGTTPIQITTSPLTDRSCVTLKLKASSSLELVYIGNSNAVTDITGYPLFNGDTVQLDLKPTQPIWLVGSAPGQTVYVMELGG